MSDVTLTANGSSVTLHGDGDWQGPGIALTGIAGWYQTPDPKITVTVRGQGTVATTSPNPTSSTRRAS